MMDRVQTTALQVRHTDEPIDIVSALSLQQVDDNVIETQYFYRV